MAIEETKNEFEMENMASIEPAGKESFLSLIPQNSKMALEKVQAATQVIDGAVKLSLGRTKPQDWVLMGGKYYLQASGVEKIRSVFGLYFRNMTYIKENLQDGSYCYICNGTAGSKLLDRLFGEETTIEVEGCRSSADDFYSKQATTDPMDVRRASYANFTVRAAKALLGFGNYTIQDLTAMGINVKQVAAVNYEKGAEGGARVGYITEPQAKRLYALCSSNSISPTAIKKHLKEKYNIDASKDILKKDYKAICDWVEAGGVEQPKSLQQQKDELLNESE